MKNIKDAWEVAVAFKLVWFRVAGYFLMPTAITFIALTDTWSGETWDNMHPFLKWRMILVCAVAGATAIFAFIDQSLPRARAALEDKRQKESDSITKDKTP